MAQLRVILYEYPFNERIRTYLRLEQMLQRLSEMMVRDDPHDHHFALVTLFEIMDIAARADLKADILKDLERQKGLMSSYRGNPAIHEASLNQVIAQLEAAYTALNQQQGKAGSELLDNDWLMSVRSMVPSIQRGCVRPSHASRRLGFRGAVKPLFTAYSRLGWA